MILLGNIMGGGAASALYKKLRYEKGLVYGVNAGYGGGADVGYFTVTTEIAKSNLLEVLNICTSEFERATSGGVTNEELEFFKTRKIKSQKRVMQTSDSWVDFHAYDELIGNKKRLSLPEFLKEINEVSINDITRAAKKYFGRGLWYLAVCGDVDEKDISVNF
jgi:predicted Zn-dependent peptidase